MMEVFEYLRTAFHVAKAFMTQDRLLYVGLGVLVLFVLWSVLELVLSHEKRLLAIWRKMKKILCKEPVVSVQTYFEFTKLFQRLPYASARNWRKYETQKTGIPSDYLSQVDMIDRPLTGGIQKQSRSIMKVAMWFVVFVCYAFSLASLGGETPITAKVACEAALVPFVLFVLYRINYYVYTTVRQFQYRTAVDEFQDFVDFLDRKIDVASIFEGKENTLAAQSNCFEGFVPKQKNKERRALQELVKKEPEDTVDFDKKEDKAKKDVFRNEKGEVEIRSQEEFSDALTAVESLLDGETDGESKSDEKTKKASELIEAMTKFRNKKD